MTFHLASWPGVASVSVLAIAFALTVHSGVQSVQRASAALGLACLVPLFLLGGLWPSMFTFAALLAFPAAVMLLVAIARPSLLEGSRARIYASVAVFSSPASLLLETLWLLS